MKNMNDDTDRLFRLFYEKWDVTPESCVPLAASGGDRKYYRLTAGHITVLGVVADRHRDAEAYVRLSAIFRSSGVRVPEVYGCAPDFSCYLVEYLGDVSLFSRLDSPCAPQLIEEAMRELVKMQTVPQERWREAVGYPPLSRRQILWDLNYFKYEFLMNSGVVFDEDLLENDFELMADKLMAIPDSQQGFMMRDCQSRNIMIHNASGPHPTPFFIDFQGGRRGPLLYDAVSMLWQAKARFSEVEKGRYLRVYADSLAEAAETTAEEILGNVDLIALFRTLQVLGAYGYRGLVQHRAHFIESIPGALANLSELESRHALDSYPELRRVAKALAALDRFKKEAPGHLVVKVFSFSYKGGYPEDLTGNGGGFMFDCRGMHNPGRYEEYKALTGRDLPVIEFLEDRGEVQEFVRKAIDITSPTIERYRSRGFSSLQIGFGCTGGRHRSVYCAEKVARQLARMFPDVEVVLCHREQNITERFSRVTSCDN